MNKKMKKALERIAEQNAVAQAAELDRHYRSMERPELQYKIESIIGGSVQARQRITRKMIALVSALALLLVLMGAGMVYKLTYTLRDHLAYSNVVFREYSQKELKKLGLHNLPARLPEEYIIDNVFTDGQNIVRVFIGNKDGNTIVFTESKTELTHSADTENAEVKTVILHSGYEGVYIEKDGASLLWQQGDYFYSLFATDSDIDVIGIASSLQKLE